jgi:hypothetical protein
VSSGTDTPRTLRLEDGPAPPSPPPTGEKTPGCRKTPSSRQVPGDNVDIDRCRKIRGKQFATTRAKSPQWPKLRINDCQIGTECPILYAKQDQVYPIGPLQGPH